jgi:hypothetical protein
MLVISVRFNKARTMPVWPLMEVAANAVRPRESTALMSAVDRDDIGFRYLKSHSGKGIPADCEGRRAVGIHHSEGWIEARRYLA